MIEKQREKMIRRSLAILSEHAGRVIVVFPFQGESGTDYVCVESNGYDGAEITAMLREAARDGVSIKQIDELENS